MYYICTVFLQCPQPTGEKCTPPFPRPELQQVILISNMSHDNSPMMQAGIYHSSEMGNKEQLENPLQIAKLEIRKATNPFEDLRTGLLIRIASHAPFWERGRDKEAHNFDTTYYASLPINCLIIYLRVIFRWPSHVESIHKAK